MRFVIIVITTTRLTMARLAAFGAYSEYQVVTARRLIPLPHPDPAFIPLMVSGLTASIALEQVGELGTGQTVLVTGTGWAKHVLLRCCFLLGPACNTHHTPLPYAAAAGATGQFAVQLAHKAGNHVIGTCSSDTKVMTCASVPPTELSAFND